MPGLLAQGTLDSTVTCSSVMDNFPTMARLVASAPGTNISLALVGRRGLQINLGAWTADKPARIAAEQIPCQPRQILYAHGTRYNTYSAPLIIGLCHRL